MRPLLVVSALVVTAAPASAARMVLTPHSVAPGHTVRIHGRLNGCSIGSQVTLISRAFKHKHSFAGVPAVFTKVRKHHRYSVVTRIPSSRAPGHYNVSGRCGGGLFATKKLTVLAVSMQL